MGCMLCCFHGGKKSSVHLRGLGSFRFTGLKCEPLWLSFFFGWHRGRAFKYNFRSEPGRGTLKLLPPVFCYDGPTPCLSSLGCSSWVVLSSPHVLDCPTCPLLGILLSWPGPLPSGSSSRSLFWLLQPDKVLLTDFKAFSTFSRCGSTFC